MEKIVKLQIITDNGTFFKEIHVMPDQIPQYKDYYDKAKFIWLKNHLNKDGIYDEFSMIRDGERMANVIIKGISITDMPPLDFGDVSDY